MIASRLELGWGLTPFGFADMNPSGFRECRLRFSLLRASTENPINGFFHVQWRLFYRIIHLKSTIEYTMKTELIALLRRKSFQFTSEPTFKLASGKMSRFYVNCKPTTLDPRGMFLCGHLIFGALRGLNLAGVGGLTFGADPLAMATAFVSELQGSPMKAFSIRKTQKDHGIVKWIEGDMVPGERVAVIEDVVTTGGSTLKAVDRARAEGLEVVKVVALIDRQEEGGMDRIREKVTDAVALITRDELLPPGSAVP